MTPGDLNVTMDYQTVFLAELSELYVSCPFNFFFISTNEGCKSLKANVSDKLPSQTHSLYKEANIT